jgi:hypothetical protein
MIVEVLEDDEMHIVVKKEQPLGENAMQNEGLGIVTNEDEGSLDEQSPKEVVEADLNQSPDILYSYRSNSKQVLPNPNLE